MLTGTRRRDHISPVLSSLHWLPVRFRINFKILLFVFKARHGLAPSYISDLLKPYVPTRSLRSAGQMLLVVPKSNLVNRGDRAFSVAAPKLWNELPLHIKQATSLSIFKTRLKTLFYSQAFNSMWAFNLFLLVLCCFYAYFCSYVVWFLVIAVFLLSSALVNSVVFKCAL